MKAFKYDTGRIYNQRQILDITVKEYGLDEFGLGIVTASFIDNSRNISGTVVNCPVYGNDIGAGILSAYDNGDYEIN